MTNQEENKVEKKKRGFPLSKFNWALELIVLVVSVFLLITTFRVNNGYQDLKKTSDNYIDWERQATQMQLSSDYLTDQVRLFAQSRGEMVYANNYFREVEENLSREKARDAIRDAFSETSSVFKYLQSALDESHKLEQLEYTAMRMTIESIEGSDIGSYRGEIRGAEVPPEAATMTSEEKWIYALECVNGEQYHTSKEIIESNVDHCISELINAVKTEQDAATRVLDLLLIQQRVWLVLFILAALTIIIVTSIQIIRPLNRAIPFIRSDKTIPVSGAEEFRELAKTYNRMHKINQTYRERLAYRANHDPLTGVLNRNGIEELLRSADLGNAALLIIDIDHFKRFNDEYGHEMGDRVLAKVTQTLQSLFRSEDAICRMGGDEFAIIMWHTGPEKKELISEKIRKANEELGGGMNDLPRISISAGVAFGIECEHEDIFHNADMALYHTKHTGRGGCTFFEPKE